jgi:hypothetical protein
LISNENLKAKELNRRKYEKMTKKRPKREKTVKRSRGKTNE